MAADWPLLMWCGAVSIQGEPSNIGVCQCDRCQRQSGSAFLVGVIFPKEAVTIEGKLATYEAKADGNNRFGGTFAPTAGRRCRSLLIGILKFDP